MRYICICQSHVFLCVFHYIASYCINTLFNSLQHILSTIYRCKTLSFIFDNWWSIRPTTWLLQVFKIHSFQPCKPMIGPKKKYCLFPISDRPYQNMCDPNLFYGFPFFFFFFLEIHKLRDDLLAVVKVTKKTLRKGKGGGQKMSRKQKIII